MATPHVGVWVVLVGVCLCSAATATQAGGDHGVGSGRRLLIRPLPSGSGACRNTYQGPHLMADDKGLVCPTKDLNFFTGCCRTGQQHTCDMCGKDDCCSSFEHCVSCCMAPEHTPEERRQSYPRIPTQKESGVWDTVFEYCMAICRTHVFSTSHENAYIGPRHHCFSKLGKPMLSPPLPAGALDGVTVVLSAAGTSCAAMCEQHGGTCSASHLHLLNSCDRLREVTACEAGCIEDEHTDTMPAAVDPEAPKANRPALCLTSSKGTAAASSAFKCDASANHMRRLCPCVKGSGSSSGSSASTDAGSKAKDGSSSSSEKAGGGSGGQQQQQLEGPDQLGATLFEGTGADATEDGAADGAGDTPESGDGAK